jgi:hypothetical protein
MLVCFFVFSTVFSSPFFFHAKDDELSYCSSSASPRVWTLGGPRSITTNGVMCICVCVYMCIISGRISSSIIITTSILSSTSIISIGVCAKVREEKVQVVLFLLLV